MNFASYIARRYFRSGRFFISVSTWMTIAGVALGVAVVCFVMSMHNGFESEIRSRLLGTTSHITVFSLSGEFITDYDQLVDQIENIPGVVAASPFIYYKAAISSESGHGDGVVVRGIDPKREQQTANIARDIKEGSYNFERTLIDGDSLPGIILGKNLADRLGVYVGQEVALYALRGEDLRRSITPRIMKFYVSGIFETGYYEFDGELTYISLQSAQKLFLMGDVATAVHLKLTDIYQAENLTPVIDSALGNHYDVVPWNVLHKNLFNWIEIEKIVLGAGFILIVLVAAFSIISTLVMLTMEKRAEIGILKTIGTTPNLIAAIFVYKGMLIAGFGVLGGWIVALVAAFIQNYYKVVSLPADLYFVSYVPIEVHWVDFAYAGLVTLLICFLAALYPALQASRMSVIEVLRK
ncbi:MAG: ABC transporter permease [bacterium]|nr:ABC transporter permease [bacterium]